MREKGEEDTRGQQPSHPANHRVRAKMRYKAIEKDKSQETKDRQPNLSSEKLSRNKSSQGRAFINKNKHSVCDLFGSSSPKRTK